MNDYIKANKEEKIIRDLWNELFLEQENIRMFKSSDMENMDIYDVDLLLGNMKYKNPEKDAFALELEVTKEPNRYSSLSVPARKVIDKAYFYSDFENMSSFEADTLIMGNLRTDLPFDRSFYYKVFGFKTNYQCNVIIRMDTLIQHMYMAHWRYLKNTSKNYEEPITKIFYHIDNEHYIIENNLENIFTIIDKCFIFILKEMRKYEQQH